MFARETGVKRPGLIIVAGLLLAPVAACHTDPFSMKPEVNVTLPDKDAAPSDATETSPEPEEAADTES